MTDIWTVEVEDVHAAVIAERGKCEWREAQTILESFDQADLDWFEKFSLAGNSLDERTKRCQQAIRAHLFWEEIRELLP